MSIVESEPPIPAEINSNKTPIASISIIKLSSQIRKIIKELSIIEKSESQLNSIITALVTNYTDYQAVSLPELTQSVKGILNNLLPPSNNNPKPDTPPSSSLISKKTRAETPKSAKSSMNLNQSIINNQRSLASKRHRPEEPSLSLNPNDSQLSLSKLGGDNGERKDNASTILPPSQHREKRRKTVTSDNDTITFGHSLHNPNNNNNNNDNNSSSSFKIHKVPNSFLVDRPKARFHDLAGLENVLNQIRELVCYPLWYPQLYSHLGVSPPCGILLHGPSGCGKTTLANAIAGETGLNYFKVSGPELIGGTSGESEERIRSVFETAAANAPSILFIDALDVIAGKKESTTRGMDRRIIAQLFDSIDAISSLSRLIDSADSERNQVTNNLSSPYPIRKIPSKSDRLNNDNPSSNSSNKLVILIVATNKPDHIDPGVRGRFAKEIALPVPDAIARTKILQLHTTGMNLSNAIDFHLLGKLTPGYVGSDLQALVREAGMIAVCRIIQSQETSVNVPTTNELHSPVDEKSQERDGTGEVVTEMEIMEEPIAGEQLIESESRPSSHQIPENSPVSIDYSTVCVEMKDFLQATKQIQPTAKREGFAVAPDISWNDIGALSEVREELKHNLLEPIAHPERFKALGLEVPAGVLFFGPPGCGKTLLAKAIANESGANFISVKGPELLNMYVGESESRVRQVFARARASAPCVIFFDELDALCPKRSSGFEGGGGNQSGNGVSERVVNQLLTELDGLETRKDVYIIAATNRLELIDDAMLRPGRLGNLLYVPLPTPSDRASILTALTRKVSISLYSDSHPDGVQLEKVAMDERAEGFSGADLSALVREAGLAVIKELSAAGNLHEPSPPSWREDQEQGEAIARVSIKSHHFEQAFQKVKPSVNRKDRVRYEKLRSYLQDGLSAIEAVKAAYEDTRDLML